MNRLHLQPILRPSAALCIAGVLWLTFARADPHPAEPRTLVVTTDSNDYCRTLSRLIDARGKLPREVLELKIEGDGMCSHGHTQGGIGRLRRALLALHATPTPSATP